MISSCTSAADHWIKPSYYDRLYSFVLLCSVLFAIVLAATLTRIAYTTEANEPFGAAPFIVAMRGIVGSTANSTCV